MATDKIILTYLYLNLFRDCVLLQASERINILTAEVFRVSVLRKASLDPIRKCQTFCTDSPPQGYFLCTSEKINHTNDYRCQLLMRW